MLNQYFAHELFALQQSELEKRARYGSLTRLALVARRRRRQAEAERNALHRRLESLRPGLEDPTGRSVVRTR